MRNTTSANESLISETAIGETLQRLRQARSLSLRTLASITEFSPSFLSQIENGQTSPSITSLDRLARALGVTLADFFEQVAAAETPVIMRAADRRALRSGWSKARFASLVPNGSLHRLDGILITLGVHGRSGKTGDVLPNEQLTLVTEGEVTLILGPEEFVLYPGDAVAIPAGCAHQWENRSCAPTTFAVITPRSDGVRPAPGVPNSTRRTS